MLHLIPTSLLTSLSNHIHAGMQIGTIDISALVALCRSHASHGPAKHEPIINKFWMTAALPWAIHRLQALPQNAPSLGMTLHKLAGTWPEHPDIQPNARAVPATIVEAPQGMPDVVAVVLALTVVAHSGGHCPEVLVHPDLRDSACEARGKKQGRALLGLLAEAGLATRPWHLWVGPPAPIAQLSPYTRDLGEALWRWGQARHAIDANTPFDAASNAMQLYTLADAFVNDNPGLLQERAEAERTQGIVHARVGGIEVRLVDLGRCQSALWDHRLPSANPWQEQSATLAPLLLQVPMEAAGHDERSLAAWVARLSQSLGATAQSITVCQPGLLRRQDQLHLQASSVLCVAGGWPLACTVAHPNAPTGCVDVLPWGFSEGDESYWQTQNGDDVPWEEPDDEPVTAAACVGGGSVLWARLLRLQHRGSLPAAMPIRLHIYRPQSRAAIDDLAANYLQQLIAQPTSMPKAQGESGSGAGSRQAHRMRV